MAPTDVTKATPKVQRSVVKTIASKSRASPATALKKTISTAKKRIERIPLKMSNTLAETRQRTNTVPKVNTPKPKDKEAKSASVPPSSVKKSSWKRRPKPAHSGVPVPEKMKALMQKQFKDLDDSL